MNFDEYKDVDDLLNKTGLTPEEALKIVDAECKKRGLLTGGCYENFKKRNDFSENWKRLAIEIIKDKDEI